MNKQNLTRQSLFPLVPPYVQVHGISLSQILQKTLYIIHASVPFSSEELLQTKSQAAKYCVT